MNTKTANEEQLIQQFLHQLQAFTDDPGRQADLAMGFALSVIHSTLGENAPGYLVCITRKVISDQASQAANDPDYTKGESIN